MPPPSTFQHLPLLRRFAAPANIRGGGKKAAETIANRNNPGPHSAALRGSAGVRTAAWNAHVADRKVKNLPVIEEGIPVLLKVDPGFDIDELRDQFDFEIVSEQEDGFVLVASKDLLLTPFLNMVNSFATGTYGSARIASIHRLFDDPDQTERLRRMLSESILFQRWPTLDDAQRYIFDFGIECTGTYEIPDRPNRGKRDSDADWARKDVVTSAAQGTNATRNGGNGNLE